MKINKRIILGILLILGISLVQAACPEIQIDCVNDFSKDPSPKNFDNLENPTAEQFARLQNPSLTQFYRLDEGQQQIWISSRADFSNPRHQALANNYFAKSPEHINQNKDRFRTFLSKSQGLSLVEFTGDIVSYSEDGTLKGKSNSVNVKDFSGKFGQNYKLGVVNGELRLYHAQSKKEMSFTGDLRKDGPGTFSLPQGTINGHTQGGGSVIRMNKDGSLSGSFNEFDGITFAYTTAMHIVPTKNGLSTITLDGGEIIAVNPEALVYMRGAVKAKNPGIIRGRIFVPVGSNLKVNDLLFESKTKRIEIFGLKVPVPVSDLPGTVENGAVISDGVQVNGEGFTVSITAEGLAKQEEQASGEYKGYLKLPQRGYFQKGDSFEEVTTLQKILGLKETGRYDAETKTAVSQWQEKMYSQTGICGGDIIGGRCVGDGLFGKKSQQAYLKYNSGSIKISPDKGTATLGNGPKGVEVRTSGSTRISLGPKQYVASPESDLEEQFYQDLNPQCTAEERGCTPAGGDMNIPTTIIREDPKGQKSYEFEQKPSRPIGKPVKVNVGGKTYELNEGEAYVVTAGQTAFTKAVAPSADSQELKKLPAELRGAVAGAGHMAVLYVEKGQLRVSESDWGGVKDTPFRQSHLYSVQKSISGIYSIPNADSSKIIEGSKADAKKGIGWFFMPVENEWGVQQVNGATGKQHSSYRSCASHVCTVASYGGVDLTQNLPDLPPQNLPTKTLQKYVESYGIGKGGKGLSSGTAATLLQSGIQLFAGRGSSFATPSQIIYGGIENGLVQKIEPIKVAKKPKPADEPIIVAKNPEPADEPVASN